MVDSVSSAVARNRSKEVQSLLEHTARYIQEFDRPPRLLSFTGVLQCVAVCCSVMQYLGLCGSVFKSSTVRPASSPSLVCWRELQCVSFVCVCYSMSQCIAVHSRVGALPYWCVRLHILDCVCKYVCVWMGGGKF